MTTFKEYQEAAETTAVYPEAGEGTIGAISYVALGLVGESGEVAEQIKKAIRDDNGRISQERLDKVEKEIGDVLWYISRLCSELDLDMDEVAVTNLDKLSSRKSAGLLNGSGSDR